MPFCFNVIEMLFNVNLIIVIQFRLIFLIIIISFVKEISLTKHKNLYNSNIKMSLNPDLDLSIKDLTIHDPVLTVHSNIPSVPFNMCVFGSSSSGKSNVVLNLIEFYKKIFKERIIIFTQSINGSIFSLEKKYDAQIYNSLYKKSGENRMEELVKYQQTFKKKGEKMKNVLVIFDDFITDNSFNKRSIYDKLYSQARHSNISVIITSQQYTLLPSNLRRLSWYNLIFLISDTDEKKLMLKANCNNLKMTYDEFEKVYDECVAEAYSFIYVDVRKRKWLKRFGV